MTPVVTGVRMSGARHRAELPLLVLGPSLGTSAGALWTDCASHLADDFDVLAWDLPGHGHNRSVPDEPDEPLSMGELAEGVLALVADVQEQRGDAGTPFAYAGVSVGGAVGLQLLLDHPDRVTAATLVCTGARIGDATSWSTRVEQVRTSGTSGLVSAAAARWFATGFMEQHPGRASALLHSLADAADAGYVHACDALAAFDVRERLAEISRPVLAIAGAQDPVTPPALLEAIADGVKDGRLVVLDHASHLAPAERPADVARLIRRHVRGEALDDPDSTGRSDGEVVRREVLGDAHVDRSLAGATDLTRELQDFITTYAWGGIWTRPGLDRRSRSMVTLTALVGGGHHEELALHLRAARRNGLTWDEIKEVLLQTAIYCGVPAANSAFRIAQQVRDEEDR
jgi:3-oxoadipate enol-lactonase/4-carboxymuconolactone decarboxylase